MAPLFYASVFYAIALIWDRILPRFEPILFGWFSEWGSLALILAIGITLWRKIISAYAYGAKITDRTCACDTSNLIYDIMFSKNRLWRVRLLAQKLHAISFWDYYTIWHFNSVKTISKKLNNTLRLAQKNCVLRKVGCFISNNSLFCYCREEGVNIFGILKRQLQGIWQAKDKYKCDLWGIVWKHGRRKFPMWELSLIHI